MADDIKTLIAELRNLEGEATAGLWRYEPERYDSPDRSDGCGSIVAPDGDDETPWFVATIEAAGEHISEAEANAALITAMRNNLGRLLDAAEQAQDAWDSQKALAARNTRLRTRIADLEAERREQRLVDWDAGWQAMARNVGTGHDTDPRVAFINSLGGERADDNPAESGDEGGGDTCRCCGRPLIAGCCPTVIPPAADPLDDEGTDDSPAGKEAT